MIIVLSHYTLIFFIQILWRETKRKYANFTLSKLCSRRHISPSFLCISLSSLRISYSVLDKTIKSQKEDYLVDSWIRIGSNLFQDSKAHPTASDITISTNHCSATSPMRTVHQGLPASYYIGKLLCENFWLWTPTDKLSQVPMGILRLCCFVFYGYSFSSSTIWN